MARRIRLRASVGRQKITKLTPGNEANYVNQINAAFKVITDNFEAIVKELSDPILGADILYDALEPTFRLSKKYVPKDTGTLEASGFLEKDFGSKTPRVVMGYGRGGSPHYAALVHEIVTYAHKSPTRAKYLLTALEEDSRAIQARIIKGYKEVLGT